ncbi:SO2930 family diheme c-type cytochrome [Hephaestia mangrovi]|uniref:SO2930 family diheme c-type cytochrome n=1 Tax=Hephaestia mangrovi TaxID=2873268 RepID=UPI001CA61D6D|nr:SO2930 family diheme c-type cytochrome [Hephaestia mangrovi]
MAGSVILALASCHQAPSDVTFHAAGFPKTLDEWGLFTVKDHRITPHKGMVTYELATPLFSDYAQKWRTIWMPPGASARYEPEKTLDFPVGTIITKTFYYTVPASAPSPGESNEVVKMTPATYQTGVDGLDLRHVRLIETRLLVHRADGWIGLPYVWNADQTEATLQRTGADIPLTFIDGADRTDFVYSVPNQNQCGGCHTADYRTRALGPIGPKARHLNRDFPGPGGNVNQLQRLVRLHYLTGLPSANVPRDAAFDDASAPLDARARAYLDVNCAHCHSPTGPARVSGLWLHSTVPDPRRIGVCKPPVAAGGGGGDRPYDIVPGRPDLSILPFRMASTDPGAMMPETGRSLVHQEGVALIEQWIAQLKGECRVDRDGRDQMAMR